MLQGLGHTSSGLTHPELAYPGPAHGREGVVLPQMWGEGLLNLPSTCHVLLLHQMGEPVDISTLKIKIHLSQRIRNEVCKS